MPIFYWKFNASIYFFIENWYNNNVLFEFQDLNLENISIIFYFLDVIFLIVKITLLSFWAIFFSLNLESISFIFYFWSKLYDCENNINLFQSNFLFKFDLSCGINKFDLENDY